MSKSIVMLVTRVWPTQRPGGMPFVCQDRAIELAQSGLEVHVVTTSATQVAGAIMAPHDTVEDGVHVHYTSAPAHTWSKPFADACLTWAGRLNPVVCHLESLDRDNLWWIPFRHKVAITMHGFSLGAWLSEWNQRRALGVRLPVFPEEDILREARILSQASRVIAISKWERRMLQDQYGLSNVKLVYNPIASYFFNPPLAKPKPAAERRGFLFASISGNRLRGFERVTTEANRLGIPIMVARGNPREAMPSMYDGVKAIVLPTSYAQGFDLTIAEARARGIPAIMTPTGSYLDEAQEWDRLVPIGDVNGFIREMTDFRCLEVNEQAAWIHMPEIHVQYWTAAVMLA